jgi:magnesium-transporting ATPase (P-type)
MSIMQCDAVLLNGNVIVNEAMLTGESVPVTKTDLDISGVDINTTRLHMKDHSRHILFSGTQVIQTRMFENNTFIKAIVIRTGFNTTKGELVRSILHPKPVDYKLNNDTYKYIGALATTAFIGMIYVLVTNLFHGKEVGSAIKDSLDVITIAVPPILPGLLTTSLIYAQNRLKKINIFCISPRMINICGAVNTFVFDKTGTLTEDGLDIKSVLPVKRYQQHPNP